VYFSEAEQKQKRKEKREMSSEEEKSEEPSWLMELFGIVLTIQIYIYLLGTKP
jgi:hypothetical protein